MVFSNYDYSAICFPGCTSLGSVLVLFFYTLKFQAKYKLLVKSLSG